MKCEKCDGEAVLPFQRCKKCLMEVVEAIMKEDKQLLDELAKH